MARHLLWNALPLAAAFALGTALLMGSSASAASERLDVLIAFDRTPGPAEQALIHQAGGSVRHTYGIVPAVAASIPAGAVEALARHPRVTAVEPDGVARALDHPAGDEELDAGWGVPHIGSGAVHTAGSTGGGVSIAIIDTGIDYGHPDLSDAYAGGHDFVNGDANPNDDNGHGTHVAGTTCASANGWGVVGVAANCDLYALKVLDAGGSGSWSGIIAAIDWAANNGIEVANLSLGSSGHPGSIAEAAFENAYQSGVVIVAAAGNSGNRGGNNDSVEYPARFSSVIAVAATNQNDARASFSSTGPAVELSAPGVSVLSTWNDDDSGTNPQPQERCDSASSDCDYYKQGSGTSMAAPHVAGVAALVIAENARLNASQVRDVLRTTAKPLGAAHQYGAGLVYAPAAVDLEPTDPIAGSIGGVVTDASTGAAIEGATVTVERLGLSTSTDSAGNYMLDGIPEGEHRVVASAEGYVSSAQSAIISVDGEAVTLDFALNAEDDSDSGEPEPTVIAVTALEPDTVVAGSSINTTITGTGFATGATVTFENGSGPAPTASGVTVVDGSTITAEITASSGGPPRARTWDVRVTNPDGGSDVLPGGLTVTR